MNALVSSRPHEHPLPMAGAAIFARVAVIAAAVPLLWFAAYGPARAAGAHMALSMSGSMLKGATPEEERWFRFTGAVCGPIDSLGKVFPPVAPVSAAYTEFCFKVIYGRPSPFRFN